MDPKARQNKGDEPAGAHAMLGFARTFQPVSWTTEDWMRELRDGEELTDSSASYISADD